jgi:hypothetical protein
MAEVWLARYEFEILNELSNTWKKSGCLSQVLRRKMIDKNLWSMVVCYSRIDNYNDIGVIETLTSIASAIQNAT